MNRTITILAPRGRDAQVIAQVLDGASITCRICKDLHGVVPALDDSAAVIVTEESLIGDGMADLLLWVEQQRPWSDLAFIVLAAKGSMQRPHAHRPTLDGLGNAVLLERPLNADSLVTSAQVAIRARRRQLVLRDLTETLEMRVVERTAALAESETRFRAMFEGFPDILFVVQVGSDGLYRFESFNPAAERRTGYVAIDVRGRTLQDVLSADAALRVAALCDRAMADRAGVTSTDHVTFPACEGTFETTLTPMLDGDQQVVRLLGFSRDVTERNRLEERLRSAQKLETVGQLTGGVAHDFNNLLQVVLSGLTLMERTHEPARRAQILDSVRRAAQRGGELIKRLLTIARRQALHPQAMDLGAWLQAGVSDLLSRTLRGDIVVEVSIAAGLPPVEVDPNELELALLNLAVNARDAMPDGGTLTMTADGAELDGLTEPDELSGPFVRLSIADTGVGMAEAVRARVFEPFFTTKDVGKGTGLGLAQVYGFARQSGGTVRLQSEVGKGTVVSLLLPIARRPFPADAAPPERTVIDGEAGAAILVCEDDDEVAALVVDLLDQLGHTPTRVSTGAAALGALTDGRRVDLLFTDVMMPGGMDGLALAREAVRRRPGLPVLLTTGYTGAPGSEPLGVPVLRKPYGLEELAHALQATFRAKRAE